MMNLLDFLPSSLLLTSPTYSPFAYLDPTSNRIVSTLHNRYRALVHEIYDRTARALLKRIGFDPDNINKEYRINGYVATPMIVFCARGDFKMCRYLLSRGADCRKTDPYGWSPLYYAAYVGQLEICKWLCRQCGAHEDIRRVTGSGSSPLRAALWNGHFLVVYWLILEDALSSRQDDVAGGGIDDMVMRRDLRQEVYDNWQDDKRLTVLSLAQDAVTNHDNIVTLLLTGTILSAASSSFRRHPNHSYATRSHNKRMRISPTSSSSPLVLLNGKSGILELIAHYVVGTPKQLRTLRQLMVLLPAFIKDTPFVEEDEEEDEDDGEWV